MIIRQGLTFDDVLLSPRQGVLNKREHADISSELVDGIELEVPIVSANMPSVTEHKMAVAMSRAGGFGFLHRFADINIRVGEYNTIKNLGHDAVVSIGLNDLEATDALYEAGARMFCLDVAHGDHVNVLSEIDAFKYRFGTAYLIAGNVATAAGAFRLKQAGVDAVKVGIGPGAACRTREVTGYGVPQLTAIMDVASILGSKVKLIADGGIKNSGDIVKALAAGADTVMIGSLLAGCNEAPNPGIYYGNASVYINGHMAPEGIQGLVLKSGPVEDKIKELAWGIKSGISYGGATNIAELRKFADFIQVTAAGQVESETRIEQEHLSLA